MSIPFVQYLLSKNHITQAAADRITHWAIRQRESIGMIAVEHGLIDGWQIDEILSRHSDRKTGQEVEMEVLSEAQMDTLGEIQKYRVLTSIAEALALSGVLPLATSIQLLADFVNEQPEQIFRAPQAKATF